MKLCPICVFMTEIDFFFLFNPQRKPLWEQSLKESVITNYIIIDNNRKWHLFILKGILQTCMFPWFETQLSNWFKLGPHSRGFNIWFTAQKVHQLAGEGFNALTYELTCKILPGGEGFPIVDRPLQHPQVRTWWIRKLNEDICDMEELKIKKI